ncbi:MAG: hypothetical protein PVTTEEND_001757, partial [Candidatus Fervidibacter sp.]
MRVKVRFFGPARDLLGDDCAALTLPDDATVTTLRERLSVLYPPLK